MMDNKKYTDTVLAIYSAYDKLAELRRRIDIIRALKYTTVILPR